MPGRPNKGSGHTSGVDEQGNWTPAFPGQRKPFEQGHSLSTTHGARSQLRVSKRAAEIADWIRGLVPGYRDADEPTVRLLSISLAQVEAAHEWLAEVGLIDENGQVRNVAKHLGTMLNSSRLICDRLGLTPLSRAQLGLDVARTSQSLTLTGLAVEAELERRDGEVEE